MNANDTAHLRPLFRGALFTILTAAALAACGAPTAADDIGVVELAMATVPPDISCVRVTATGPYRDKEQTLAAVPGMPFEQALTGVPLGLVTLDAEAFDRPCEDVTARTVPTWVAVPEEVSVVAGSKTRVELIMQRNGRVDATFTFSDEPQCSAVGIACRSSRECCSGSCKSGTCQQAESTEQP